MVAAALFAAGALAALALVWFWPDLLRLLQREEVETPSSGMTTEEKLELLRQFGEEPYGEVRPLTQEEKSEAVQLFETPRPRNEPPKAEASQEDKLEVLNMF